MNIFLKEAYEMQDELVKNRRHIHENAELGFDLEKTRTFVMNNLKSYGYDPKELGGGITCTCGSGSPVLMLRADMDALPQQEISGLEFSCKTGACHSCGHDGHTTMLLAAAKMLKKHETELKGTVKFMFQAGEETLRGSRRMLDAGILENPKVDAAMGFHMNFGPCGDYNLEVGSMAYGAHQMMASADEFKITVKGKSVHGSMPEQGINALSVAANIITSVQQIITLEVPCENQSVISICQLNSGIASNIIPESAEMFGSIRTFTRDNRNYLKKRLIEISETIAKNWRAEATVEFINGTGPNINDPEMAKEMAGYAADIMKKVQIVKPIKGSEDFANIGEFVPTFFANICAGGPEQGYDYSMHNPKARFDEEALVYGSATFVNCAINWLANHSK